VIKVKDTVDKARNSVSWLVLSKKLTRMYGVFVSDADDGLPGAGRELL